METQPSELTDWEYLQNSAEPANSVRTQHTHEDEDYSDGIIRADYFSVDSQTRYATRISTTVSAASSEESGGGDGSGSAESDNPSWIDPVLQDNLGYMKETSELWSDSGSDDRSNDRRIELGFVRNEDSQEGFDGIGKSMGFDVRNELGFDGIRSFDVRYELGSVGNEDSQVCFEGIGGRIGKLGEFGRVSVGNEDSGAGFDANEDTRSKSVEYELDGSKFGSFSVREELGFVNESKVGCKGVDEIDRKVSVEGGSVKSDGQSSEFDAKSDRSVEDSDEKENVVTDGPVKPVGEVEKRSVVWWKGPLEFLKYFVFRVSPVWSFSVAAAMVGFVILGRRLYRMKRKSQGLDIKVTVDDKKVSQFMSRAARLNEAFSVVRRVPIVRPVLPTPGMASWPVISLR